MALPSPKKTKTWVAWFNTKGPTQRKGPLFVAPVEINDRRRKQKLSKKNRELIISIPRACGNAVRRNRLKRIFRAELLGQTQVDLWIRLQHKFRLKPKILRSDWAQELASIAKREV